MHKNALLYSLLAFGSLIHSIDSELSKAIYLWDNEKAKKIIELKPLTLKEKESTLSMLSKLYWFENTLHYAYGFLAGTCSFLAVNQLLSLRRQKHLCPRWNISNMYTLYRVIHNCPERDYRIDKYHTPQAQFYRLINDSIATTVLLGATIYTYKRKKQLSEMIKLIQDSKALDGASTTLGFTHKMKEK